MGLACCKEYKPDLNSEVELGHFHLLRSVGKGAFGKVRIVQHRGNKKLYALKYINKAKCIKMKAVENIIQERKILEDLQHPFICNLRFAFQDDENLFMVLDLMLGGDLRFHLDRKGVFSKDAVRFYCAEISSALAYLHSHNIVHRDLKPDNILLDENGHCHLTDFNIAVRFKLEKHLTAVAGSMAYMAPEILAKKGYFSSVDWWSLGVVAFELLFRKRPFKGKTNEELTRAIQNESLHFPQHNLSPECTGFIKGLMTKNVKTRLGTQESGGFANITSHAFLKDIDWIKLDKKELISPFLPDSNKANFDATHELEELLLEDNPLRVKERKNKVTEDENDPVKPGDDPVVTKALRTMEKRFTVLDYTKPKPVSDATQSGKMIKLLPITKAAKQAEVNASGYSLHMDVMEGRDLDINAANVDLPIENTGHSDELDKISTSPLKNGSPIEAPQHEQLQLEGEKPTLSSSAA